MQKRTKPTQNCPLNPEVSSVYHSLVKEISAKIVEGSNSRVSQSAPLDVIPEKELPALHVASTDSLLPVSKVRQEPDVFQVPFTPVTKAFKGRVLDIAPAIGTSEIPHEGSGSDREDLNFNGDEAALSLVKGRERLYLNHYSFILFWKKTKKKKKRKLTQSGSGSGGAFPLSHRGRHHA